MDKELKELDTSTLMVGDILWNPFFCDLWLVKQKNKELRILLIYDGHEEELDSAEYFQKVGNVYDVARKFLKDEYLAEQQ